VFERITKDWGKLDFVVHSIAFSPKDALQGRVVDVSREGFLTTMDVSCWTFIRMAHLAEPLMRKGGTLFTMNYYGSQMVVKNYNATCSSHETGPVSRRPEIGCVLASIRSSSFGLRANRDRNSTTSRRNVKY
jgi:hypothetical protein